MLCKNCGTQMPDTETICPKCGTDNSAEELNLSAAGTERAVPRGFSAKKNIIIIIIAAVLLIGGGITAIAVVNSHSASSSISDKLKLAERYLNEQNYEQAIIEYQKVLEIEPMNVDAYLGLADAYIGNGEPDKAISALRDGMERTQDEKIKTRLIKELFDRARKHVHNEDYDNAIDDYTSILELDDKNADAYLGLEDVYLAQGQTDKALEILNEGLEKTGDNRILTKLEELRKPLTANELSWAVEPVYEFEHIRPIPRDSFYSNSDYASGQNALSDRFGGYEAGFPSYASTEAYYEVKQGNGYTLFCQSDRTLYTYSSESMLYNWRNGEIVFDIADFDPIRDWEQVDTYSSEMVIPKELVYGFPGYRTGYWDCKLLWDTYTEKAYLDFEDDLMLAYQTRGVKPISPNLLNKNYPIQKYDLSPLGTVPQEETYWEIGFDDTDDLREYHIYSEAAAAPVDKKYALWSPDGKLLTDFIYDDMCNSSYGLTAAKRGGKWGYLDENGKEITEFIYGTPWLIKEDTYAAYPCTSDTMVVSLNGKKGVLYRNGKTLIEFGEFDDLAPAWNDQLWAKQGGKWGIIDLKAAKRAFGIDVPDDSASSGDTSESGSGVTGEEVGEPTEPVYGSMGSVTILDEEYDIATTTELNLRSYHITDEQLKEIAPEIAKLVNLTALDLGGNQISDLTPLVNLTNLTKLDLSFNQIINITPLENLANLTELTLAGEMGNTNKISDITPLAKLANLVKLNLSGNQISDITPLAKLTDLTELDLAGGLGASGQISDITPLANLTNLTKLYLGINQISDVTPLAKLINLTELGLWSNQISDITPLAKLTNLTYLDLGTNQIGDIMPLSKLTNLTNLNLENNQISDITPLEKLTNLTGLNLENNNISDIMPLAKLTNLTWLELSFNQISKEDREWLKTQLPNCSIYG